MRVWIYFTHTRIHILNVLITSPDKNRFGNPLLSENQILSQSSCWIARMDVDQKLFRSVFVLLRSGHSGYGKEIIRSVRSIPRSSV